MIRHRPLVALIAALAVFAAAGTANARTVVDHADTASASVCARNLASVECGRYQQRLLRLTALRAAGHTDAATLRENGRLQLDTLIDSIS